MTKSKFKVWCILWFIFMNVVIAGIVLIIFRIIEKISLEGYQSFWTFIFALFLIMFVTILIIFKDFKYIIVNLNNKTLKWFSIFQPLGKTVELKNFIGLIKSTEYGSAGSYETIHLVDKSSMTSIKINGIFYKNFDEIYNSIELDEIKNYRFGIWKYLKLLFTGRMLIEN